MKLLNFYEADNYLYEGSLFEPHIIGAAHIKANKVLWPCSSYCSFC